MPFPLLALIPALMSMFGGGAAAAGGAAAGTAAGAGAAGGAAGGMSGLLGGLLGGTSGGAAAGGGGLQGLLGGLLGQGGAAAGPVQLAGPGVEATAPAAAAAGSSAPAAGGGAGGIFGNLLGAVAQQGGGGGGGLLNMVNEIAGGPGRAYMTGAMAGKGDFKGAMNAMDQHSAVLDRQARTGILGQGNQREQEKFDIAKGQQAKVDAANAEIQKIFEDPKSLDNLTDTLPKVLSPLLRSGNHQGAHDVLTMLSKAATDKTENSAALAAGDIVRGSRKEDGSFDWKAAEDKLAALGNPHAVKAFNALRPSLAAEGTATNQANMEKNRNNLEEHRIISEGQRDRSLDLSERRTNAMLGNMGRNQDIQNRRLDLQEEQQRRLAPSQGKILTQQRNAVDNIDNFSDAYEAMAKENGGKVSASFKGWLAKNPNAQTLADISGKISPAERTFAATVLSTRGNLRSLSDEVGVFTKEDENRILASYDPTMTPAQVRENLKAVRQRHERVYGNYKTDYEASGKDVSKYTPDLKRKPSGGGAPQQAIDYLKSHPEAKDDFQKKYGYLP